MLPPKAKKVPKIRNLHNDKFVDNYFWLRDKSNPDVISYLEAENAYTKKMTAHTEEFRNKLYEEMKSRIKETDLSVPVKKDQYYYYHRTEEGKQYRIYCRKKDNMDSEEEVILDVNKLAEGKDFFMIGTYNISPNHKLLEYSSDINGSEQYTIHIKNLETGELLPDEIPNTYYSLEWGNDNKTLFYTVLDDAKRSYKLFRHTLGTDYTKWDIEEIDFTSLQTIMRLILRLWWHRSIIPRGRIGRNSFHIILQLRSISWNALPITLSFMSVRTAINRFE
jgi:oligopeptidase B